MARKGAKKIQGEWPRPLHLPPYALGPFVDRCQNLEWQLIDLYIGRISSYVKNSDYRALFIHTTSGIFSGSKEI
jgi:hypothetical protein